MNRRWTIALVVVLACLAAGSLVFAGGKSEAPGPTPEPATAAAAEWTEKEAPMLHELVQKGQLPPLAERLPRNPLVVKPFSEVGRYGGTFRRGTGFFMADEWLASHIDGNSFWRFQWPFPGSGPVQPNLADEWTFSADGKQLTIHIREGIKWSDGQPFTIDDVLFFLNDVVGDENVTYTWYHTANLYVEGRTLPGIQRVDDYTIRLTYPEPAYFMETMYAPICEVALPAHVLKQHHPKYNAASSYDKFNEQLIWANGRGRVTLNAWMLESFEADKKMSLVRNPYYWKVDTAGNQLPYFDRMDVFVTGDRQGVALGNATGRFDNDAMWVGVQHLSLFLEEQPKRDFTIGHSVVGGMGIYFNFDAENARARRVIRNRDFRRAFSVAINRPQISKAFFYDTLMPMGSSFSPNSAYFEEEVGKLYSEFDPERAKKILDDGGIRDRDGDGVRELPTGEKCEVVWSVYEHDLYTPIAEIVVEDLAKVGIRLILDVRHQNIILDRLWTGQFEIGTYDYANHDEPLAGLDWWIPIAEGKPFWHNTAGTAGPFSSEYGRFVELMQGAKALPFEQRVAAVKSANKIMAENVFAVHIGFYQRPNISSNRIGNLPHQVTRIDEFGSDAPPFMYFQTYEKYPPK